MPKYADVEKAEAWLNREDWGTPDERWRPESEFCAMLDSLQRIDVVPTELYKMDRLAFFRALKRLTHLLKSDYIRSFDEVDPKTGEYKRDIMEADASLNSSPKKAGAAMKKPEVSISFYDKVTRYSNCTVEVLENTATGEISVGWYRSEETEEINS